MSDERKTIGEHIDDMLEAGEIQAEGPWVLGIQTCKACGHEDFALSPIASLSENGCGDGNYECNACGEPVARWIYHGPPAVLTEKN